MAGMGKQGASSPQVHASTFHRILADLAASEKPTLALAELDDFLMALPAEHLPAALEHRPAVQLNDYLWNYTAAMIEQASHNKQRPPPQWVQEIPPLSAPVFYTNILSLRLHLLLSSPIPFRRRNIFIDTGVGGRV